jgi:type IV pilus assembly protein PilM
LNDLTIANRAVGIDIGTHSVKIVSMQQRLGSVNIEKVGSAPIERGSTGAATPELILAALRKALEGIRIRKDLVVVGISTQSAAVRTMQVPFSDIKKARAVIKFQAETHLPFSIEDVVIDFFNLETGTKERMDILLTAIRKQVLQEELSTIREAGIDPEVLEVDFMASCNTVNRMMDTSGDGVILMDIGASKTIIAFIKDGVPLSLRSFAVGGDTITNSIVKELALSFNDAEQLKITSATALASAESPENARLNNAVRSALDKFSGELQRTMRFLTSQLSITGQSCIVLAGGGALLKGMPEFIHESLGHKTVVLDSLGNVRNNSGGDVLPASYAAAIGLALRGIGETRFPQNFRQEELAYSRAYKRLKTNIMLSAVLFSAIILTYITGIFFRTIILNNQISRFNAEIRKVAASVIEKPLLNASEKDPVGALRIAVQQKNDELAKLRGKRFFSVLEILKALSTLIPKEMEVEITQFNISDAEKDSILILKGTARNTDDINSIESILNKCGFFSSVKEEGSAEVKGKRIRRSFRFRAVVKDIR